LKLAGGKDETWTLSLFLIWVFTHQNGSRIFIHRQVGADPQSLGVHKNRVETVARLCGAGSKKILDLGTGPGATAAALADAGHQVIAVELNPSRANFARDLTRIPRKGSLIVLEDDFYTMELNQRFDLVCCWETFGLGTDADQPHLLKRIANEWLGPNGSVLMDVYSPVRPVGKQARTGNCLLLKVFPVQLR